MIRIHLGNSTLKFKRALAQHIPLIINYANHIEHHYKHKKYISIVMLCVMYTVPILGHHHLDKEDTSEPITLRKEISKSFTIDSDDYISIVNKYGQIEIKQGYGNAAMIKVDIEVSARKKSHAQNKLDEINIIFEQTSEGIQAETDFENSQNSSWWDWLSGDDTRVEVKVNYIVTMPIDRKLILDNKYGNIIVCNYIGDADITLKYGRLNAGDFRGGLKTKIGYSDAIIGEVSRLNCDMSYSDINIEGCRICQFNTKYSKVKSNSALDAKIVGKYDEYKISTSHTLNASIDYTNFWVSTVRKVDLSCKYSDISISQIIDAFDIVASYGKIDIKNLSPSFTKGQCSINYTPLKISSDIPIRTDITGKYFSPELSAEYKYIKNHTDNKTVHVIAYKKSQTAKSNITIKSSYGHVTLL